MQLVLHGVHDIQPRAVPVDALVAIETPRGDDQGGELDAAAPRQVFGDRRDQEYRQLGRAFQADPRQAVLDVRVSKPLDQGVLVFDGVRIG